MAKEEIKKIDDCITRNVKSIKTDFMIGEKKIEIEQRFLTNAEVKDYQKSHIDIMQDKDIFLAILEDQKAKEEDKLNPSDEVELSNESRYVIHQASTKMKKQASDIETRFIAYSVTNNMLYGGYYKIDDKDVSEMKCVVNGEELKGIEKIIYFIDLIEPAFYNELLKNVNKLQYPTADETEQAKSSQVE